MSGIVEQQIPEGYKQTEAGIIPESWSIYELGKITMSKRPISYGIVQTGPNIPGGVKCLRVVDISNGVISKNDMIATTQQISNSYRRTQLKLNDLVIPLRGKIGDVGIIDEDLVGANLTRGVALIALEKNYCGQYVKQAISSESSVKRLENSMNGSALQEIPIATLRLFKIAIPEFEEQTAIANALSDVDALITSLEKLITKKRAIKTAAMQQLLTGKKRLSPFDLAHTGYKQTELGEIPEDWAVVELGEQSEITKLAGFEYSNYFNGYKDGGRIIVLRGTNITHNVLDLSDVKNIPESTSKQLPRSKLFKGDLVFAYVGTIGPVYLVEDDDRFHLGPNTAKITCKNNIYNKYLFSYFKSTLIRSEIEEKISVGAQPSLSMTKIRSFKVILPSLDEQKVIANTIADMDEELHCLNVRLNKTQQLKQGMMQELLTGRTRLI